MVAEKWNEKKQAVVKVACVTDVISVQENATNLQSVFPKIFLNPRPHIFSEVTDMSEIENPCGLEEQEDLVIRVESIKECISCSNMDCPAKKALLEMVKSYD